MHAPTLALLAALVLHAITAAAESGAVIREPGAVYLEDFLKTPVKLTTTEDTAIYYQSDLRRYLGTIRRGEPVELQAVGEGVYRVRGKAQQGQVAGWVQAESLTALKAEFLTNLRRNAARKAEVDALIAKNEVAINMTPEEVTLALGKPSGKTSRLDAQGRADTWEFVRYERVPQEVTGYDRFGRLISSVVYVKVPNGKLSVSFEDNLVSALEQSEGSLERDARVKIVTAPFAVTF